MSQKVDNVESRAAAIVGSASAARPRALGSENRAPADTKAQDASGIRITAAARQLAQLEKLIADVPVVDSQRVGKIEAQLAEGRYRVDAQKVAERLLRSNDELSRAQRRDAARDK
jgi:negative regulator of flagellin synthesis FlgM